MTDDKKIGVGFGVMLLKDNKILLGKRHDDPEKAQSALKGAGTWTMPGGKLHFGETFEEGATREILEETGIRVKNTEVIAMNNDKIETAHFITIGLLSKDFEGDPQILEPNEITEWKWFSLDNLPLPLYFPSAKVLENYKRGQFYLQEKSPVKKENRPKVGIGVLILKDNKILFIKRKGAHGEGSWCPPGGHLEFNEQLEECAKREVLEETDLKVKNIKFAGITNDIFEKEGKHYITIHMMAEWDSGQEILKEPDKSTEIKWFDWNNLPQPLFVPIDNLIKQGFNPFNSSQN